MSTEQSTVEGREQHRARGERAARRTATAASAEDAARSPTTAPGALRAADHRRHRARHGPAPDQDRRRGLRADGLRPGVHEHRLVPQRDHLHRRRRRHPPAPRLPDRAAVRALQLPRGRLPADQRRAADARRARRVGPPDHDPHLRARERQGLHAGLPLRRQPDGHARRLGGRAVDLLPGRQPASTTRTSARSRSSGCWRRCRRWRRSPSATTWASRTCTPTTTSTTPATSSG